MRKAISFLFVLSVYFSVCAQDVTRLNGFAYLTIEPVVYQSGAVDVYSMMPIIREAFVDKGFGYYPWGSEQIPLDLKKNYCLLLSCYVSETGYVNSLSTNAEITLSFRDCNGRQVYTCKSKGSAIYSSLEGYYQKAVKKALREFQKMPFSFNPTFTPTLIFPEVETTDETEQSLTSYFDSNPLDEIEGIYKSYQSESLGHYKMGIRKYGNKYKAIIIESDNYWKPGEVKAVFEPSSMKGYYSTKWFNANKTSTETFAYMENPAMLMVEFKDNESGEKRTSTFIKLYPSADVVSTSTVAGVKATGSGFVVSTDGIIATNAHVVSDASRIEIQLNNELGAKVYSVSVLLKDESNDVALLKIDDDDFKGFNSLPYSILNNTDVGEDVYTIGYPLNSLMGDNFKVTNGIISSNSGLNDDVRFIQITTPIQPGNSGGPLFNKDGNVVGLTTSKLNENAVGTSIENVNYAIKATYLINIYNMIPNNEALNNSSTLSNMELKDQVKVLQNYVCLIKVY